MQAWRCKFWDSLFAVALSLVFMIASFIGASAGTVGRTFFSYRPDLGFASPKLDIYPAANAKDAPVLIYIHGGGWTRGSRSQVGAKPDHFIALGFIFVSVDYRLVPKVKIENQLEDIDHALGWINQNIGKYGGNANNLHLMGHSAGAHLVAMTGVAPGKYGRQLIDRGALRTIISNDTMAYDMPRIAQARGGGLPAIYAKVFGGEKKRWENLSPQHHVNGLKKMPAWLVMFSGQKFVRFRTKSALNFAYLLRQANAKVSVFDGSKFSHREMTVLIGVDDELTGAIDEFLGGIVTKNRWE